VSKQINQIKRNPSYIYEEATHENAAEAESMAYELLLQRVNEYIASKGRLKNAENVIIKDIKQKGEALSMMRGTMYRVFVYVQKRDIEGVGNTTVINNGSGTSVSISDSPQTLVDVQSQTPISDDDAIEAQPSQIAQDAPQTAAKENPAADETAPVPAPTNVDNSPKEKVESPLSGWQKNAIESLLDCADVTAVRAKLNRLKAEYKVKRYGTADKCTSPDASWWAIFDNSGKLVTILGPATPQRINYKNMQYTALSEFKGMNALWFNLSK